MSYPVTAVTLPTSLRNSSNGHVDPSLLVDFRMVGRGYVKAEKTAAYALAALFGACQEATGRTLTVTSRGDAYRPYQLQLEGFLDRWEPCSLGVYLVTSRARRRRFQYGAATFWKLRPTKAPIGVPGTSNHGWGLAFDLCEIAPDGTIIPLATSGAWSWLLSNAHRYGFSWESSEWWHLRYFAGDNTPTVVNDWHKPVGAPVFAPEAGLWWLWPLATNKPTLGIGSAGDAVRYAQGVLKLKAGHNVLVDGDYGAQTSGAVQALQSYFGLAPSGKVDIATWRLIDSLA